FHRGQKFTLLALCRGCSAGGAATSRPPPPPPGGGGGGGGGCARNWVSGDSPSPAALRASTSPRKRGEVETAAIRQRGCEWVPSGKTGRRALNAAHPDDRRAAPPRTQPLLKLAALILVVAALGLP